MENETAIQANELPEQINVAPNMIVYGLYILSVFTAGFAGLVGVIVAYVFNDNSDVLKTHRQYQIRQFWMSFLYGIIIMLTVVIGVGYFIALAVLIWSIIRCVKGIKLLMERKPIPNPKTWLV